LDTKWKNRSSLFLLALLFTLGVNGVLSGLTNGSRYLGLHYYETAEVQHQLDSLVDHLAVFELGIVTEEEARQRIAVTPQEIEEHRYRYGDMDTQLESIRVQYESGILEAVAMGNEERVDELKAERDAKLADIRKNFENDEHVGAKIRKEKEAQLAAYFGQLEQFRGGYYGLRGRLSYYLKDVDSGKIFTNVSLASNPQEEQALLRSMLYVKHYPGKQADRLTIHGLPQFVPHNEVVERILASRPAKQFEGWIALPKSAEFLNGQQEFEQRKLLILVALIAGSAMLVALLFLGRRSWGAIASGMERLRPAYERLPIDVRAAVFLLSGAIALQMLQNPVQLYYNQLRYDLVRTVFDLAIQFGFMTVMLVLSVSQLFFWYRTLQEWERLDQQWRRSLISRTFRAIGEVFRNRKLGTQVTVYTAVAFGFGLGGIIVGIEPELIVLYVPAAVLVALPLFIYAIRQVGYLNRIMEAARDYEAGRTTADLPVRGRSVFAGLAANLNQLKRGVVVSQAKEAKSERLKTELITNVSHDLRTPLTAVISYVELLKNPDLTEEERASYIGIIDQRSQRLKVLIEDLFEATKMASGNVELNRSRVDLVQLMKQAIAESEEGMEKSELQFRIKLPETAVYANVDGQKMWRVFDNLLSNILRHSMERTRVYVTLTTAGNRAELVFKNIAKYELGDNVDELLERFKRGDGSRHTDGSGLGLAIAKSIVDLHGGSLELEVDGDLFKVTVLLPLE